MAVEKVSIKQFGMMVGVSDAAVHKAIKAGKIVKGYIARKGDVGPFIIPKIAAEEYGRKILSDGYADVRKERGNKGLMVGSDSEQSPDEVSKIGGMSPERKAKLKQLIYKSQIAELQAKKMAGELVLKEDVYRELFAKGQALKEELLAIADRVTDDVRAAETRNDAHKIIYEAVERILLSHSSISGK
jgi:hypothetical protein